MVLDVNELDFEKTGGLIPVIIQHVRTAEVLMLGYMNEDAFRITCNEGYVTFYSRTKKALWKKGETSGNTLQVEEVHKDCDSDALLIKATPKGPTCHKGIDSCFGTEKPFFLDTLEEVISQRKTSRKSDSYTSRLFSQGISKIAQKVGEEAVEVVIASQQDSENELLEESADLVYHLLVLLKAKGVSLDDVITILKGRAL